MFGKRSSYVILSPPCPATNWRNQRLMSLHIMEDLTSCILDFQANIIRVTYRKKTTLVDPISEPSHAAALDYIWTSSKLSQDTDENDLPLKWRKLGFETEDMVQEFSGVGVLGLDCLVSVCEILRILGRVYLFVPCRRNSSKLMQISQKYAGFNCLCSLTQGKCYSWFSNS